LQYLYTTGSKAFFSDNFGFNIETTDKSPSIYVMDFSNWADPTYRGAAGVTVDSIIYINKQLADIANDRNNSWSSVAQEFLEKLIGHEVAHWADYADDGVMNGGRNHLSEVGLSWETAAGVSHMQWDAQAGFLQVNPPGHPNKPWGVPEQSSSFELLVVGVVTLGIAARYWKEQDKRFDVEDREVQRQYNTSRSKANMKGMGFHCATLTFLGTISPHSASYHVMNREEAAGSYFPASHRSAVVSKHPVRSLWLISAFGFRTFIQGHPHRALTGITSRSGNLFSWRFRS
jgi:hypothetical protein